ncbi:BT_3928 family protein [Flavihumibacter profundi]|uniref:BT_3928 family protein n=1 Tax=Flavihumibacter profundi TaxID=2716883 RepID=UPI001CC49B8A|nr:BT_3928 family protein [Flavihumibacter profundi]MBZ5856159.1 DoxX family membrane protein [Flavihumibacter profundi]
MKPLLTISRYIVGILFIFSGMIKANDPLGLSYKMQEFFEVWGLHGWNDYTLALSIAMIAFEIIAGIAVIIGWQMKLFSWLLLGLIVFFTFLTGYALFSGKIRTCGCFGDCIPLTAGQSFTKDIFLLFLILFLFGQRNRIVSTMPARNSVLILSLSVLFSFGFQWWVLRHLPAIDCLPYKKGKVIANQIKIPPGAIPDSTVITFVYSKNGKELEFTAEKFPADFDDSVYHFVKRYDKLVRKGNAEPPIKDFVLITASGTDTTQSILSERGPMQWLFIQEIRPKDLTDLKNLVLELRDIAATKKIPLFIITPAADAVKEALSSELQNVTVLRSDVVAVKTAARYPVTLYLINDGAVMDKWSLPDGEAGISALQLF